MNFRIYIDTKKGWKKYNQGKFNIFFKGYSNNMTLKSLFNDLIKKNFSTKGCINLLNKLDGHFSLIFFKEKKFIIAADRISSVPLIIKKNKSDFIIADNYINICKGFETKKNPQIDFFQSKILAMSGFTFGKDSLFKNIIKTLPGMLYIFKNKNLEKIKYYDWQPYKKKLKTNHNVIKNELKRINELIISKLIKSSNNRCIAVPLSAGYDSRFILSGLVKLGYKNIFAFSYGRKENREKKIAKKIVNQLKIPWTFIEFNKKNIKEALLSHDYQKFKDFSDLTCSIHFPQDFFAIKFLKINNIIPTDSIIVNGQTGDFISGNHIPFKSENDTYQEVINAFVKKHFKISKKLMTLMDETLKEALKKRISSHDIDIKNLTQVRESLQKIEYEDRQAKYVIGGQRTYEYFGYDWRLPLWDKDYISFWEKTDIKYKINQSLYKEVLEEQNWADVWKKYPLNPKNTFPINISILRFIFKCIVGISGKENWHKFELRFLDYFITPLCGYSALKYLDVALDNKGYTSPLGWHTQDYLNKKGINWKGLPLNE